MRTNILSVAEELASRHEIKGFILPANSGETARAFQDKFGEGYQYFAVGNPASSHGKGYVYHSGMSDEIKQDLEGRGFVVVLQEVSAFQPMNNPPLFAKHAEKFQESLAQNLPPELKVEGPGLAMAIEATISGLMSEQVRVCVEIMLMAGESDQIDFEGKYMAICTPSRYTDEMTDCATVLIPSTPSTFFQHPPQVIEAAYSGRPK